MFAARDRLESNKMLMQNTTDARNLVLLKELCRLGRSSQLTNQAGIIMIKLFEEVIW